MKYPILYLFITYCFPFVHGQMILNQNGEAFTGDPFFNADFIQRNKIKTIKGQYSFKKIKTSYGPFQEAISMSLMRKED